MNVRSNRIYRKLADMLDAASIDHDVVHGGVHPRLVFSHGGREHSVVMSNSPSDRRAWLNARAYLRRTLRGAER